MNERTFKSGDTKRRYIFLVFHIQWKVSPVKCEVIHAVSHEKWGSIHKTGAFVCNILNNIALKATYITCYFQTIRIRISYIKLKKHKSIKLHLASSVKMTVLRLLWFSIDFSLYICHFYKVFILVIVILFALYVDT